MNHLAHSFLAFTDGQIVGQFLEHHIRNSEKLLLPSSILEGIILHRAIDTYTDQHPIIQEAKKVFSPLVRLYAGAFVDVSMDYFLANDTSIHTEKEWKFHAQKVYRVLRENMEYFPVTSRVIINNMIDHDWLIHYREEEAINRSFENVLSKAKYLEKDIPVMEVFLKEKEFLKSCYLEFFPQLIKMVKEKNQSFHR